MFLFFKFSKLIICLLFYFKVTLVSSFLHTKSLLGTFAYVSTESSDCLLLSSLAREAILLTSSVNTLYFLLLHLCCDFCINLLFFYEFFMISLRLSILTFFVAALSYFQVELLLNVFYNL